MTNLVDVASAEDLPPGAVIEVEVGDMVLALANAGGKVYAVDGECSHMVASLAEGRFDEEQLTLECPLHGSMFDLLSGEPLQRPARRPVATFPVQVQDGRIKVDLDGH